MVILFYAFLKIFKMLGIQKPQVQLGAFMSMMQLVYIIWLVIA